MDLCLGSVAKRIRRQLLVCALGAAAMGGGLVASMTLAASQLVIAEGSRCEEAARLDQHAHAPEEESRPAIPTETSSRGDSDDALEEKAGGDRLAGAQASGTHTDRRDRCDDPVRDEDEIWIVSSRHLKCLHGDDAGAQEVRVRRYDATAGWVQSSAEAFFASHSPQLVTCFYVHGARIDPGLAIERGRNVFRSIARGADEAARLRFVLWSWPAEPERGPLRSLRAQARRTDVDAYYLGQFLSRFSSESKVSLIGFSYGARVVTGGLHVLFGGGLAGQTLTLEPLAEPTRPRCVLWVAAVDADWLLPGAHHGRALDGVDRMLNLYNSCDMALKRYHVVVRCGKPEALGYTGLARSSRLGEPPPPLEQRDLCCVLGREHSFVATTSSRYVFEKTRPHVLWESIREQ